MIPDFTIMTDRFSFDSVAFVVLSTASVLACLYALGRSICILLKTLLDVDVCSVNLVARQIGNVGPSKPRQKKVSDKSPSENKDC